MNDSTQKPSGQRPLVTNVTQHHQLRRGVVTLLDVLGWKGIWQRISAQSALSQFETLLSNIKQACEQQRGKSYAGPNIDTAIKHTTFLNISDTIGIFTSFEEFKNRSTNDDQTALNKDQLQLIQESVNLHGALCSTAIVDSIKLGIPVRGATAVGDFYHNENTFIGPAVDEVAAFHEAANWIGVHLTPSAEFNVPLDGESPWIDYVPPLKMGGKLNLKCVDWTSEWKARLNGQNGEQALKSQFGGMGPFTPAIAPKYMNTISFYQKMTDSTQKTK